MRLPTFFNLISLAALVVVGGVSAQDPGANFIFKCTTPGQVALTFDDGPSPFTPELLGYLDAAKVPATFFVLGIATDQYPKTLKATFDAGHQIALHSNTHANMNLKTPAEVRDEYALNIKAVKNAIGVSPTMARPPFGNCNEACAKVLEGELGLKVIQWNCDSNDWQYEGKVADQPKLFTNMETIINNSNPKVDSFITLQHDIKDYSVKMVPKIIDMIKAKGYSFVTVEQCLGGKFPSYSDAKTPPPPAGAPAPAPAPAPAKAPAPAPAPASAPKDNKAPSAFPSGGTPAAAQSSPSTISASSADKITSVFALNLIGLAFGILMY